jgi:hypothetical protein
VNLCGITDGDDPFYAPRMTHTLAQTHCPPMDLIFEIFRHDCGYAPCCPTD